MVSLGRRASCSRLAAAIVAATSWRPPPGRGVAAVRHATEGRCSFWNARSVTRSATARAVVYFVPATLMRPSSSPRTCSSPSSARDPSRPTAAGTVPRCTSVTSSRRRSRAGNTPLSSAMKAEMSDSLGAARPGSHRSRDSHVPKIARVRHGTRKRCRPDEDGPPRASSPASRRVTRFIAFRSGGAGAFGRLKPPPVVSIVSVARMSNARPAATSTARAPVVRLSRPSWRIAPTAST